MGNLLGAPVTEKETHTGKTCTDNDNGVIEFGVSTMQGWRVHMEDAHICETRIYAAEAVPSTADKTTTKIVNSYKIHELLGHSIYAVFDGHGGKYSALYSGYNFCRVLSRQSRFIEYANLYNNKISKNSTETGAGNSDASRYLESALIALKDAMKSAFLEVDKEIALALRNEPVPDATQSYQQHGGGSDTNDSSCSKYPNRGVVSTESNDETITAENAAVAPMTNATESQLREEVNSGTTACVVIVTPNWIICANAGDSRSVLCTKSKPTTTKKTKTSDDNAATTNFVVKPLSFDHKPESNVEETRIRAAGGYVAGGRVDGDLSVSRGLGDFRFKEMNVVLQPNLSGHLSSSSSNDNKKFNTIQPSDSAVSKPEDQKISPVPDMLAHIRSPSSSSDGSTDQFIIVACDGIWDVQNNIDAVTTISTLFQEGETNLGLICEEFCDIGLQLGSKDNMTALVVKLPGHCITTSDGHSGGGVLARRKARESSQAPMNTAAYAGAVMNANNNPISSNSSDEATC